MSISVMSWVWKNSKQEGGALLTLLAMADFADDSGVCWPSTLTLANKARLSRSQIFKILRQLKEDKEIMVLRAGGGVSSTRYLISTGVSPTIQGSITGDIRGYPPVRPDPSLNRKEPLLIKPPPKKRRGSVDFVQVKFPEAEWDNSTIWLKQFLEEKQTTFVGIEAKRLLSNLGWWLAVDDATHDIIDPYFLETEFAKMKVWMLENPSKAPKENVVLRFVHNWLQNVARRKRDGNQVHDR